MTHLESPGVKIDDAHGELLAGLIRALKPFSVLEFGFGGGGSARYIQTAIQANGQFCTHTLVDNWKDWDGERPHEASDGFHAGVRFIEEDECAFTLACRDTFDFIFSDADHAHANEWFSHTYDTLLKPGGILAYHDVCNYPNLAEIVEECYRRQLRYVVFNRNSLSREACARGILVIFKPL